MDISGLIGQYGYLAVVVGAFLEGETVLALAGLAARRGYLDFAAVAALAALAGFAGDQLFFFAGRFRGPRMLARFPALQAKAQRMDELLARWHAPVIVMVRFMYGFRIAGPVILGVGRCPAWKFVVFNAIGAAIWAPLIAGVGWVFGAAAEKVLADVHAYEGWLFAALVVAGLAGVLIHRLRRR